jgi:hypothetical protein
MKIGVLLLIFTSLLLCQIFSVADDTYNLNAASGIGYYKAVYMNDTIPSTIDAGTTYPVSVTFLNNGMVSWEWGVEKFGMLYQGLQSSIEVQPVFSQIPEGTKVLFQSEYTFPLTLIPPEKPGEYNISFSMALRKGEDKYEPFPNGFTKKVYVIPKEGVSTGSLGSIIITSYPSGAVVLMGSEEKGTTPITLPDLNPASYEITISHPDYPKKWLKVKVEAGSVNRVSTNLTTSQSPDLKTEKILKFTPVGWFLENLPMILITIVIGFLAFQVAMMDTKHVPENHPIRVITRPITFFKVSPDGKGRFFGRKRGDKSGKTGEGILNTGDNTSGKGDQKSGTGKGDVARKGPGVRDRSVRREGDEANQSKIQGSEEEEFKLEPDVY